MICILFTETSLNSQKILEFRQILVSEGLANQYFLKWIKNIKFLKLINTIMATYFNRLLTSIN